MSIIAASKNDTWEQNSDGTNRPIDRLSRMLEWTIPRMGQDDELVIVDFGSIERLEESLPRSLISFDRLRIAYVPPERAAACGGAFSEPHALNFGARLARGQWVARIDQDTLIGDTFFRWMDRDGLRPGEFAFANRRDMREGQRDPSPDDPVTYPPSGPQFYRWHVGVLMVERERWHRLRGMDETNVWLNHMEHEWISRLSRSTFLFNLGLLLSCPFHHQNHPLHGHASRPNNRMLTNAELATLPDVANDESWGMADLC